MAETSDGEKDDQTGTEQDREHGPPRDADRVRNGRVNRDHGTQLCVVGVIRQRQQADGDLSSQPCRDRRPGARLDQRPAQELQTRLPGPPRPAVPLTYHGTIGAPGPVTQPSLSGLTPTWPGGRRNTAQGVRSTRTP